MGGQYACIQKTVVTLVRRRGISVPLKASMPAATQMRVFAAGGAS